LSISETSRTAENHPATHAVR